MKKKNKNKENKKRLSSNIGSWECCRCKQVWVFWVDRCNCLPPTTTRTSSTDSVCDYDWLEIKNYEKRKEL